MKQQPSQFTYLGKIFTPVEQNTPYDWNFLSKQLWGSTDPEHESMIRLLEINKNFNHTEFYKVAKKHGCGKIDVFLLDGEKVIPCKILRWYSEPKWHADKFKKERYIENNKRYIFNEIHKIQAAIMQKIDAATKSGAIPENWFETDNVFLGLTAINSFCADMPYKFVDNTVKEQSENIHLFI